jgi:NDP-sugar pyrophosphorylase family protein
VRILHWLRDAGVSRTVLNLHHRADSITRLVGDGSSIGIEVRYSWEAEVLGSAGGPARAIPLLASDRFLIVNGDTLAGVDLRAMAAQHVDTNALVTMAVVDGRPEYNGVVAGADGIVRGFGREPGAFHFIGIQIVNASVFAGVRPDVKSETVHGIYPPVIASRPGAVRVFHTTAEFFDIGSPRDYLDTAITIAGREGKPLDRGRDCTIGADAQLLNTVVWDRVSVGAGARLSECVVADDVAVASGAEFSRCSLVMRDNKVVATPF